MVKFFDELREMQKAYNERLKNEGESAFKEAFKEVMDKHPVIDSIEWTQYTPYWNDGDPCYFRVGEFQIEFNEDLTRKEEEKVYGDVDEIFSSAGDDVFESVFGDHRRIEVTRDGISVRKYDHD